MTPERWQRIESLFHDAIERGQGERAGFLASRACDDDALRQEVESLLVTFEQAPGFMERSPLDVVTDLERQTGRTIGRYEVISLLGVGGMGEVYLARDAQLDRHIALKLLPAHLIEDQSEVLRFEREARAASALNHPNIITVHEIGREGAEHFIATEFVEGQTLRQKISGGKIELGEAIAIAVQIATALQAAHEAGIVHRDIKPENIMVRPDGLIKVLDFGLAKPVEREAARTGKSADASLQTDQVLMGTISYLAPEQARAEKVDHRADLFSLGVVIYEMISRERPFRGDSADLIFDAIMHQAPVPLADSPQTLQRIVNRALAKQRAGRYQTAGELRDDLQQLARELDSKKANSWSSLVNWKTIAAAVVVASMAVWFLGSRTGPQREPTNSPWSSAHSVQLTDDVSVEVFPSLAPDGGSFVFASRAGGNWDICLQRVDERVGARKPLNLTRSYAGDDTQPSFSPDGRWVAFRSNRDGGGIFMMSASGESVRRLTDAGFHPAWSPDGEEILCTDENIVNPDNRTVRARRLWAVKVSTGEKRIITTEDVAQPQWSPQGHRIAYWGMRQNGQRDIWTMSAIGGAIVQVTDDEALDWNPVWAPDGRYLYFASNRSGGMKLWRVPLDERSGRVLGEPELIPTPSAYSQHISFSRDGKLLAYAQVIAQTNVQKIGFDAPGGKITGKPSDITQGSQVISAIDTSPNGEWLVCDSVGEERESIFLLRSDGRGGRHPLTTDEYKYRNPCFSPDGKRIAFYSNRSGYWEAWTINIDGSDIRQLTFTHENGAFFPIWSPDGNRIAYTSREGEAFVIEAAKAWSDQTPIPAILPGEPNAKFWPRAWSADGSSLIGVLRTGDNPPPSMLGSLSLETRRLERFSGFIGGGNIQIGDEHRLLFRSEGRILLGDKRTGGARELLSPEPNHIVNFALSSDKRTLYFTLREIRADIWMLATN